MDEDTVRRRQAILQAVQEQMNSPESPDVKSHYDRLRALGYDDERARELIATVLSFYIWHVMQKDGYGYADYVAELARLPEIDMGDG